MYLAKMPPAISGQGGHDRTMEAARVVVYGFDLGPEVGFQLLCQHYNPRCDPSWSEKELRHKCEEAASVPFGKERGWLLNGQQPSASASSKVASRAEAKSSPLRLLPRYEPFPLDALPIILREYVDASSAAIGCDPSLVALPALAVAAGAIGNSRAPDQEGLDGAGRCVGRHHRPLRPLKSPAFASAVDPFLELQMELVEAEEREREKHASTLKDWRAKKRDDRGSEPEEPAPAPCYLTSDATIEAVGELLRHNPRGLLLARDELDGWFQGFTRNKKSGVTDRPHWLELSRAGTLRLHRITRERGPLSVRRASCSITGTIQPAILGRPSTATLWPPVSAPAFSWRCHHVGRDGGPKLKWRRT